MCETINSLANKKRGIIGYLAVICLNIKPLTDNTVNILHNKVVKLKVGKLEINRVKNINESVIKIAPG
jgi:hypothetical protein